MAIAEMMNEGRDGQYMIAHQPSCALLDQLPCDCVPDIHRVERAQA